MLFKLARTMLCVGYIFDSHVLVETIFSVSLLFVLLNHDAKYFSFAMVEFDNVNTLPLCRC